MITGLHLPAEETEGSEIPASWLVLEDDVHDSSTTPEVSRRTPVSAYFIKNTWKTGHISIPGDG